MATIATIDEREPNESTEKEHVKEEGAKKFNVRVKTGLRGGYDRNSPNLYPADQPHKY